MQWWRKLAVVLRVCLSHVLFPMTPTRLFLADSLFVCLLLVLDGRVGKPYILKAPLKAFACFLVVFLLMWDGDIPFAHM